MSYKNFDIGLGVFASYVNYTRDADLEGFFSKKIITRLHNTSVIIYNFTKAILKKKKNSIFINLQFENESRSTSL